MILMVHLVLLVKKENLLVVVLAKAGQLVNKLD
jgi:hypothetical protein